MKEEFMTSGSAGRVLKRTAECVRIYARSGRLPSVRTDGGTFLFSREDVLRLADELAQRERRGR